MSAGISPLLREGQPTGTAGRPALALHRVCKKFGDVDAVRDVSLVVPEGEFVSILGPSGCGKSTLLRLIAGFLTPSSGQVEIQGRNVEGVPAHRRPTNMVFQQLALFPHLTVFANIAFGLRIKRRSRAEIAEAVHGVLAAVDLAGYEDRRPSQLSGGQQQRVAIARALVNQPAALLLDEPLGALDLRLRRNLQVHLRSLNRRTGTTFVYVTHDQEEAMAMSDRIAVMNAGEVEQVATPVEIYQRPANRYVAEFVGETNLLDAAVVTRGAGALRVTVGGYEMAAHAVSLDDAASRSASVTLSLRPESISLVGRAGSQGCQGTVREATFLGSSIRYTVDCPLSPELTVRVQMPAQLHQPGTVVTLSWDAESAVVLPPSAGATR